MVASRYRNGQQHSKIASLCLASSRAEIRVKGFKRMRKRKQNGCITVHAGQWALRWRETVVDETGSRRHLRFKSLGEVTAEHRRRKDSSGKLRIPGEIQEAADEILKPLNDAVQSGINTSHTIGALVEGEYFPDAVSYLRPSTIKSYRDIWRIHLKRRISGSILREYRRAHAYLLWKQIRIDNPELTKTTLQHIRCFLSAVFKWAKNHGLYSLPENPATADLPEGLPRGKETHAYTAAEVVKVLSLLGSPRDQAIVAIAYGGGLRAGELCAIRWEDYRPADEGKATIHVRQSYWKGHFTEPKTEASADVAKLGAFFALFVENFRAYCGGVDSGLMFAGSTGKPLSLENLARRVIAPALNRCAVCHQSKEMHGPRVEHKFERDVSLPQWHGFHAFRRGSATQIAAEQDPELASLMLRHSGTQVTERHYIKNSSQDRRAIAARRVLEIDRKRDKAANVLDEAVRIVNVH
jgi:integrase